MQDAQSLTPAQTKQRQEELQRRYKELQRNAQESHAKRRAGLSQARNPEKIDDDLIVADEVVPGGWYWTHRIDRGDSLRIINQSGKGAVAALFWNADDPSERFNAGDTVKVQWNALIARGAVLFSDMGRVLVSVTDDICGAHDALVGGSSPQTNQANYGNAMLRNTRDNFLLAGSKYGLDRRDIPPCISFFAPVRTNDTGGFVWQDGGVKEGDYVDLRAEMNVIVALSNCPHPLDPRNAYAPGPIRVITWRSPEPAANDLCRNGSDEAVRGFQNNFAYFRA